MQIKQMQIIAYNTTQRPLGTKQQALADDMKLQVCGMLTAELYAQGWHTERRLILGRTPAFWFAPEVNQ